jgi:hypothetical protein
VLTNVRLHLFIGTTVLLFGWYYLVDTLPRSQLIPDYVARISAVAGPAAARGELAGLAVEQPMFYVDSPVVSVRPGEAGGYEIRFSQVSKRRCDQITGNGYVRQAAGRIVVSGGACGERNELTLVME